MDEGDAIYIYLDELELLLDRDDEGVDEEFQEEKSEKIIDAYFKIPRKIRVALQKKKFCYESVKMLENNVTCFLYCHQPQVVYFHIPENCHERFLIHAIAKYNELNSESKMMMCICLKIYVDLFQL